MDELKGIIFDMDGVIVDSEPIHYKVNQIILKDMNIEISEEEYNSFIGVSNPDMWSIIKDRYGLKESLEDLVNKQNKITLEYLRDSNINPINGIVKLLEELKNNGLKVALASSSSEKLIELILNKFHIQQYFIETISGENFAKSKPNPQIFFHAAKKLKLKAEECVVIEDSKHGIEAAKRADMKAIGYKNINSGNQDLSKADLIVESIREINVELIKNLF
ncbi:HAD family hydrolase [Orenia marismortui]|uniref:HAD family hydrolase n=1 Tax=Orenia marismortui TaxID=46469 RepID=UPI00036DD238|nr:HAD family phosphatase [Orenia marismortui]